MAKNKMTVSIQGPALVNADKNMLRAVKKALITVGKIGAQEVRPVSYTHLTLPTIYSV